MIAYKNGTKKLKEMLFGVRTEELSLRHRKSHGEIRVFVCLAFDVLVYVRLSLYNRKEVKKHGNNKRY